MKRISIVGTTGSGKSYLSRRISQKLSIPVCELDDIYWHNENGYSNTKRDPKKRDKILNKIVSQKSWIIEGVYYTWLEEVFDEAEKIIILNPPLFLRDFRILKRYIKGEQGRDKDLSSAWASILWGRSYVKKKLPLILEMTEKHKDKRLVLSSQKEIELFIKELES